MDTIRGLSKRERQVMDVLYQLGQATVSEVEEALTETATYSAVRATLRVLEEKGHVEHKSDGPRYLYMPTVPQDKAKTAALSHVVGTFFNGSAEAAVMALLQMADTKLSKNDIARLSQKIREANEEGR
jgi:predicted transcriptional regulator